MSVTIVVGAQWGDEGKGKIVDVLARSADVVVRYSGGNNAGHSIMNEYGDFVLHLIPAGIFNNGTLCLIERGVVIHPPSLLDEMNALENRGIALNGLKISPYAHMVMPWHIAEDRGKEIGSSIGTTLRGIGPCYQDKVGRWHAIRMSDLVNKRHFLSIFEELYALKKRELSEKYPDNGIGLPDFSEMRLRYLDARERILPHIEDTTVLIHRSLAAKKQILLEGAQGTLLDNDYGSYPYVTSSNTISMAACMLTCIPPMAVKNIIGVAKAYVTRVGNGPFPTEITTSQLHNELQRAGREFGATTGRPRRCGWLDLPLLRYACMVNGFTEIALTKIDILGLLERIRLCTGYKNDPCPFGFVNMMNLDANKPEYQDIAGWGDLQGARFRDELPTEAQLFIKKIENYLKISVKYISIGGKRKEIITL